MEPAGVLVAALTHSTVDGDYGSQSIISLSESPSSDISRFSCSHVVPNENVMAMVVGEEGKID